MKEDVPLHMSNFLTLVDGDSSQFASATFMLEIPKISVASQFAAVTTVAV